METEKQGYSAFERIMFFLTPILFTLVLLGVLLTLFNFDVRNKLLEIGGAIPLLSNVLPAPEPRPGDTGKEAETAKTESQEEKVKQLQAMLDEKEAQIAQLAEEKQKLDASIAELQKEIADITQRNEAERLEEEQYEARIKELAAMYADMSPSKAAPILESLTMEELVLVLDSMKASSRSKIMEKLTPQTAAEASMRLKDLLPVKDRQMAALQARANATGTAGQKAGSVLLEDGQLQATFSSMDPKQAGALLLKMSEVSPSKVLRILSALDDRARSGILAAMAEADDAVTAQLVSKLMAGK